jgi:uncharacterized radical SAM superfamily Fe-S cluster-containing enzyme
MNAIRQTESVCPDCLATLPATVYEKNSEAWMRKHCTEHGQFDVYLWPDAEQYSRHCGYSFPRVTRPPQTEATHGCPKDCGLCPGHKRKITLPEIEVSWRCNLSCPVCFMADGRVPADPSLDDIVKMLETIRQFDGPEFPLQITGGEPTIREDLPAIIAMARQHGATDVELNTNGVRLGRGIDYVKTLKDAGVTNVYLQFDGLNPETTVALRGRDILCAKLQAIENCRAEGVPVILSVTIVEGVNDRQLGSLIEFAMHNLDVVYGLALQPAFVSGRFDMGARRHLSVGDVASLISDQTHGKIRATDFLPVGSSHPLCYGSTYLLETDAGYLPFTRELSEKDYRRTFDGCSPQGAVFKDIATDLSGATDRGLAILIMEYMDAWTMDLERARECNLAVTIPDGRSIPFCIYHLTNTRGERLYPHGGRAHAG